MPQIDLSPLVSAVRALNSMLRIHASEQGNVSSGVNYGPTNLTQGMHQVSQGINAVSEALTVAGEDPEALTWCHVLLRCVNHIYDYNLIGWQVWAIDPAIAAELEEARGALESLQARRGTGQGAPVLQIQAPEAQPTAAELKERGFERFTAKYMNKEWGIGIDEIELMAQRATGDDHIHGDWKIITPNKQRQLWARRKV